MKKKKEKEEYIYICKYCNKQYSMFFKSLYDVKSICPYCKNFNKTNDYIN